MLTNVFGKCMAAFAQLYAMYVFTAIHTELETAMIFLLSGYAIWFQVFEMGLSQTLQNKFNNRKIQLKSIILVIIVHYLLILMVAVFIVATPYLSSILLPVDKQEIDELSRLAFSIGAGILVLATSNILMQRFFLIINKGIIGNYLLVFQSLFVIFLLYLYHIYEIKNLVLAVVAYFGPQLFIYIPVIIILWNKNRKINEKNHNIKILKVFFDSIGFCGLGFLSAIFLGSDYYFVAHYLSNNEVIYYYLVTRIFFISYIIYYAYLLHRIRHISSRDLLSNFSSIKSIIFDCYKVGIVCVLFTFLLILLLNEFGVSEILINQSKIEISLLFFGFLYFFIRIFRDVGVVVASSLGEKNLLYKVYLIEIIFSTFLMFLLSSKLAGVGIFISMAFSCCISMFFLFKKFKILNLNGKLL